jgi:hypothetical protein
VKEPGSPDFFLQWINSKIFKDVEGLMNNIRLVTGHLASKNPSGDEATLLRLIPSADGKAFFRDAQGEYWRLFNFIPDTHIYKVVDSEAIAEEGGLAFGRFMSDLSDLPANLLKETIPDFHNMESRLKAFSVSVDADVAGRADTVRDEIRFVEERAREMMQMKQLISSGELPLRITHNDTKINNVLFNSLNKAVSVVDLDTVMPGTLLFDFGDAIRTGACTSGEDEQDLSLVNINIPVFEAYARGFIRGCGRMMVRPEIENMAYSARYMTFIIGLRFLTDYLDGDPYFRTLYPDHNLVRTRVQFSLLESMEKNADKMHEIIMRLAESKF